MEHDLNGLVAVVTGAASERGIGRAVALELARAGADVVISDIGQRSLVASVEAQEWRGLLHVADEVAACGRRCVAFEADVSRSADVNALIETTVRSFGRLDIVVNNAATRQEPPVAGGWELSEDDWNRQIAVNLTGTFVVCKAAIPHMLGTEGGRIINISSLAGRLALPRRPGYTASKHGLIGLTRSLALDLAAHGITANAICPGVIDTDRATAAPTAQYQPMGEAAMSFEQLARTIVPLGRQGTAAEVARLATFLASPSASYITGQAINVDGGWNMA